MKIIWDEDHDERIYKFIELYISEEMQKNVYSIGERSAFVTIIWYNHVPMQFKDREEQDKGFDVCDDYWTIYNDVIRLEEPSRIIDKNTRYIVLKEQKWKCNNCHKQLKFNKDSQFGEEIAHIDHIHPYSKMYSYRNGFYNINERANLQGLCEKCNLTKHKNIN